MRGSRLAFSKVSKTVRSVTLFLSSPDSASCKAALLLELGLESVIFSAKSNTNTDLFFTWVLLS